MKRASSAEAKHQLHGRRQALGDDRGDRSLEPVGDAEIALHGVADEADILHDDGVVEAEPLAQGFAVGDRRLLADHVVDRVAHIAKEAEAGEGHDQHDDDRLDEALDDEGEHAGDRAAVVRSAHARD